MAGASRPARPIAVTRAMPRFILCGLVGLSLGGVPALAADPGRPPAPPPDALYPAPTLAPGLAPPVLLPPPPPALLPRPLVDAIDLRTGRCLAGFAPDAVGFCRRHDDPPIVCPEPDLCGAGPPSLTPYGIGPALRLNY